MDFITDFIAHWWDLCINYYKVNPVIFISMYSVKSVIFWWTIIYIVKLAINRKWNSIPGWVFVNVSTNVSPWIYIWIYGENLPFWYSYMVYFIGGWAICYLIWDVRRRVLEHEKQQKEATAKADGTVSEANQVQPEADQNSTSEASTPSNDQPAGHNVQPPLPNAFDDQTDSSQPPTSSDPLTSSKLPSPSTSGNQARHEVTPPSVPSHATEPPQHGR